MRIEITGQEDVVLAEYEAASPEEALERYIDDSGLKAVLDAMQAFGEPPPIQVQAREKKNV